MPKTPTYKYTIDAADWLKLGRSGYEALDGYPGLQYDWLYDLVVSLGESLNRTTAIASKVTFGKGTAVQFYRDLAASKARYNGIYRNLLETIPDDEGFVDEAGLKELAGMLLYWKRKDWEAANEKEVFTALSGPMGTMPEALQVPMLWTEAIVRDTVELQQLQDGFVQAMLTMSHKRLDALADEARTAWSLAVDAAEDAAENMRQFFWKQLMQAGRQAALHPIATALIVAGLGYAGYTIISKKR
jgi:predicted Rossmann-fold nucleotide-binding protein